MKIYFSVTKKILNACFPLAQFASNSEFLSCAEMCHFVNLIRMYDSEIFCIPKDDLFTTVSIWNMCSTALIYMSILKMKQMAPHKWLHKHVHTYRKAQISTRSNVLIRIVPPTVDPLSCVMKFYFMALATPDKNRIHTHSKGQMSGVFPADERKWFVFWSEKNHRLCIIEHKRLKLNLHIPASLHDWVVFTLFLSFSLHIIYPTLYVVIQCIDCKETCPPHKLVSLSEIKCTVWCRSCRAGPVQQ